MGRRLKDVALGREPFHPGKQFRKKSRSRPRFPQPGNLGTGVSFENSLPSPVSSSASAATAEERVAAAGQTGEGHGAGGGLGDRDGAVDLKVVERHR